MSIKVVKDYYIKRKAKLLKDFDSNIKVAREILRKRFNDTKIDGLFEQMGKEYERLIPEIPYIGGQKNSFTTLLIGGISNLAMFRTLENEGFTYSDIGEFYYEYRDIYNKIRKNTLKKIGKDPTNYPFESEYIDYVKKLCEETQKRKYPDDWIGDYIEGDGNSFEWGFNFHQCGIHKVFKRLGAEKYVAFLCLSDFSEANILGFGFKRTRTLGNGSPLCDHRYVKNYKTPRAWPPDNIEEFKWEL